MGHQLFPSLEDHAVGVRVVFQPLEYRHYQRAHKLACGAQNHDLVNIRMTLKKVFQLFRGNVFAPRSLEEVFLAAGNAEITFFVHRSQIARVEPPTLERDPVFFLQVVIPGRDVGPLHQNFAARPAFRIVILFPELKFDTREQGADGSELRVTGIIDGNDR